ncbi:hypothetical protein [Lysinibacillus fusiformis]|uniref:hypothetical protein n=1 Tax=Lysinibacillus fusiformis TaxID=28031 RepID=UPI001586852F|nr:hypothetical protein [Lysinibacillus fusiformis]
MERYFIYSATIEHRKTLIEGVKEIRETRKSYKFIGKKGIILAIIPREKQPLIYLEKEH